MKAQKASPKTAPKKSGHTSFLGKMVAAVKGKKAEPAKPAPKATPTKALATKTTPAKSTAAKPTAAKPATLKTGKAVPPSKAIEKTKEILVAKTSNNKTNAKGKAGAPLATGSAGKTTTGKSASGKKGSAASHLGHGDQVCREIACEGLATTGVYCRLHYIKNWKKIKRKDIILREKKLNQYIEELVMKYPDKYIEAIRQDLATEKDFSKVIQDLDLDESIDDFDADGESADALVDSIKREFEDGDEGF